ncbi:BRO-N domain-containing protein [Acidithiobacillus sp.]|uniref:BRO-N domain-containing protein n=1 Tax=Acidithiobacillus sp. TaxID=1872118 RepID=UPI003D046249
MSREILPFQFEAYAVRVVTDDDGQVWFNANDVCLALEYLNPRKAIADHVDPEDVTKRDTLTGGGQQLQNHVNESGLYALIFGSTKPAAKRFKRWVTSAVLPTIRKTGGYRLPGTTRSITDDEIRGAERLSRLMAPYLRIFTKSKMRGEVLRAALETTLWNVHGIDLSAVLPLPDKFANLPCSEEPDAWASVVAPKETPNDLMGDFLRAVCRIPLRNGDTVGQTLSCVVRAMPTPDSADVKALASLGVAVKARGENLVLAVAVRNPALAAGLGETRWRLDGSWKAAFRSFPYTPAKTTSFSCSGSSRLAKAYQVPLTLLPIELAGTAADGVVLPAPEQLM